MKKTLLSLFAILLITSTVLAQHNNREKIKALKTSYITNALNLSPKEAEQFWPVYNLYSNKIQRLKMQLEVGLKREIKLAGGVENITNVEAQKLIDKFTQLEQQITDTKLILINELSKIISAKKIIRLKKAERDFNRRILQEYGKRRRMQGY
ncbi:MAG: hypothetical protein COC22_06025 [Flavobacteriaceae bacterium]|nr:MAG: hypothetical protein COC22_06025 [Flavobacteriaceae bacterium]